MAWLSQIGLYIKIKTMKKIIFTSLIAVMTLSTFAQGNSQKNKNKSQNSSSKKDKEKDDDRYEGRDNRNRRNDDGKYEDRNDNRDNTGRRQDDRRYDDRNDNNDKYSKNTPRKVGDAFRNDFPNATNVRWTKDRGTWTATFGGGGLFGGTNSATYKANGQRISNNRTNNGIFGRRN